MGASEKPVTTSNSKPLSASKQRVWRSPVLTVVPATALTDEPEGVVSVCKPAAALEAMPLAVAVADPDWSRHLGRCAKRSEGIRVNMRHLVPSPTICNDDIYGNTHRPRSFRQGSERMINLGPPLPHLPTTYGELTSHTSKASWKRIATKGTANLKGSCLSLTDSGRLLKHAIATLAHVIRRVGAAGLPFRDSRTDRPNPRYDRSLR